MKRIYLSFIEQRRRRRWVKEQRKRKLLKSSKRIVRHLGRGQKSQLLQYLRNNYLAHNIAQWSIHEDAWVITIPEVFSFIHNPGEALNVIFSLLEISRATRKRHLVFDHRKCREIELGASAVLDVVVMHLRREWIASRTSYQIRGYFPEDSSVAELLRCTGLTKHLRIRGAELPEITEKQYTKTDLFIGRRSTASRLNASSDQEKRASALAKHLDQCFRQAAGMRLSRKGLREIVRWAGELITNAEEHSGIEGGDEWFAISYMRLIKSESNGEAHTVGECHLVIFSFGKSIYESLNDPNTPISTREQVRELAESMSKKPWFGKESAFSMEDLWTLYALQEGVSRFNFRPGSNNRGSGTVTIIDAFQKLGDSLNNSLNPEMVLISGSSRIYFNQQYHLAKEAASDRKVIAFNSLNDLREKPDAKHVNRLPGKFPGTLISFKFFIDANYLRQLNASEEK